MNPEQIEAKRAWSQRHRDALREEGRNAHGELYLLPADDPRRATKAQKEGHVDMLPVVLTRIAGFAADMKAQNLHVGMGSPPRCVTCDNAWPCPGSKVST